MVVVEYHPIRAFRLFQIVSPSAGEIFRSDETIEFGIQMDTGAPALVLFYWDDGSGLKVHERTSELLHIHIEVNVASYKIPSRRDGVQQTNFNESIGKYSRKCSQKRRTQLLILPSNYSHVWKDGSLRGSQ